MDNNVYRKVGRKYEPFGYCYKEDYLTDGIWYVRHGDYSRSLTNANYLSGIFKVGEDPGYPNIPKICSMQKYVDYVLRSPEMNEILDSGRFSWQEMVSKIVALVIDLNEKLEYKKEA